MGVGRLGDSELAEWQDQEGAHNWQGLLLGNGASRAVWEKFKYESLYDVACSDDVDPGLSPEDQGLFMRLGRTKNFEAVLGALLVSRIVCEAVRLPVVDIDARYASVRDALVQAVHRVHVPWDSVAGERV